MRAQYYCLVELHDVGNQEIPAVPARIPCRIVANRMITDTVISMTRVEKIFSMIVISFFRKAFSPRIKTLEWRRSSSRCVFSGLPAQPDSVFFACSHSSQYSAFFFYGFLRDLPGIDFSLPIFPGFKKARTFPFVQGRFSWNMV